MFAAFFVILGSFRFLYVLNSKEWDVRVVVKVLAQTKAKYLFSNLTVPRGGAFLH